MVKNMVLSHIIGANNIDNISLIIYYEVPEEQRDEMKRMFDQFSSDSCLYIIEIGDR
jgi:hypothetical protein